MKKISRIIFIFLLTALMVNQPIPTVEASSVAPVSATDTSITFHLDLSDTYATDMDVFKNGVYVESVPVGALSFNYTANNLSPGTQYTYSFQVYEMGNYINTVIGTGTTTGSSVPATPANFKWTEKGDNYTKLSWSAVSGATSYTVKRGSTQIYSGSATTYTDTGLTKGTSYTYTLYASNTSGNSGNATLTTTAGSALFLNISAYSTTQLTASWGSTDPIIKTYTLTSADTGYVVLNRTASTSIIYSGLKPNTLYNVKLEGFDVNGVKIYESYQSGTTKPVPTPKINYSTIGNDFVFQNFIKDPEVSSFNMYRDNILIYSGPTNSYTDNDIINGQTHQYKIVAVGAQGVESTPLIRTVDTTIPINVEISSVTSDSITFKWSGSNPNLQTWTLLNNTNFDLYVDGEEIYEYTVTGLSPDTTYEFEIDSTDDTTQTYYYLRQNVTTASGSLDISLPSATIDFGAVTVDGTTQSLHSSLGNIAVNDTRATGEGWNVTVSASQFTQTTGASPLKLPVNSLKLNGISTIMQISGNSSGLPSIMGTNPWTIDSGAVKILSAATGAGMGGFNISFPLNALTLNIDTSKKVVDSLNRPTTYSANIDWIVSTGP